MNRFVSFALFAVGLFAPTLARADDFDITGAPRRRNDDELAPASPPSRPNVARFGLEGQFVLSTAATSAYVSSTEFDGSDATYFSGGISPGLDYFFTRHVSIGFDLEAYYSRTKGYGADGSLVQTTSTTFAGGPRIGVDLPLGDVVSFYPRVTLGAESIHQDRALVSGPSISTPGATASATQTNTGAWVNVFTPLLLHPRPHFFVGAGPRVFHGFAKTVGDSGVGGERTTVGASLVVGGYWGGEPEEPREPPEPAPPERRFGDRGELVISSELTASIQSLTYGGSDAQYLSIGVSPGFDVFVANHVSVGLDVGISYGSSTGYGAGGTRVDYTTTSFGLAPRLGVDVPLGSALSLYPRLEIGMGSGTQDEVAADGSENRHTVARSWVSAFAPLLVHPAPHFFVGFGPSVLHELSASDQNGTDNRRTTLGASLLLGGWL